MKNRRARVSGVLQWLRLTCIGLIAWTGAAAADTYLILSLVGDRLTVVGQERQVGSNLDRNRQQVVQLKDQSLDDFAVRVADAAIRKSRPSASTTMLRASDPSLYSLRDTWLDTDSVNAQALLSVVAKLAPSSPDTHLLLIAPRRDELQMKTDRNYVPTGSKAGGLGFYIDQQTLMGSNKETDRQIGRGFLGLFANFQILLINLQTSEVQGYEKVAVGTTVPASEAPDKNPWNALSAEQKIRVLQSLLKGEIERVVTGMLVPAKP